MRFAGGVDVSLARETLSDPARASCRSRSGLLLLLNAAFSPLDEAPICLLAVRLQ